MASPRLRAPSVQHGLANAINDAGKVVGNSYVDGVQYATLWSGGVVTNLGTVPRACT